MSVPCLKRHLLFPRYPTNHPPAPTALNPESFVNSFYPQCLVLSSVQLLSHVRLFPTPWTATRQASVSITNSRVCSNSCPLSQWCHPTISSSVIPFSSCLRSFPASGYFHMSRFFSSGGQSTWVSAFSISHSNENSGLIFFRIDWLNLLSVQGTLKSLLQHHSSKASILRHSAFFISNSHIQPDYWENDSFD